MKVEWQTVLFSAIASTTVLFGIYTDLFLSFEAYKINASHFITYESNREIVGFFANQNFPFIFLFTVITIPIGLFGFVYFYQQHKTAFYRKEYIGCIILFVYSLTVTRISAGLTWFGDTRDMMTAFQSLSYILLGIIMCLLYIISKEAKRNETLSKNVSG